MVILHIFSMSGRRAWVYYKDISSGTFTPSRCPQSSAQGRHQKRLPGAAKASPGHKARGGFPAVRGAVLSINRLPLSVNCKQVGIEKLHFLVRAAVTSTPFLSKGTKPWYSSKSLLSGTTHPRRIAFWEKVLSLNTLRHKATGL